MLHADRARQIYQTDQLTVSEDSNSRWLHIADESILSAIALEQPELLVLPATQMIMMALLFLAEPKKVLLLGLGGGDSLRFFRHHFPATQVTAVEVDAQMIQIAEQWFALPAPGNGFTLVIDDARHFMAHSGNNVDMILLDILVDSCMPEGLRDLEFFAACERNLSSPGVLAMNMVATNADLLKEMFCNLQKVFQAPVVALPVADHQNVILFVLRGSTLPFKHTCLSERAAWLQTRYLLPAVAALDSLCRTNSLLCE